MSRRKNAERDRRKPTETERKQLAVLGAALRALDAGQWQEATAGVTAILDSVPDHPIALMLAGRLALEMVPRAYDVALDVDGDVMSPLTLAWQAAERAVAAAQGNPLYHAWPDGHWLRGTVLARLGRYEEALVACGAALRDAPHRAEIWTDLGSILAAVGRYDEALAAWDQAAARPHADLAAIAANEGPVLATIGDWSGWQRYEARLDAAKFKAAAGSPHAQGPRWLGEPMPGETLLVYHEQGLGDGPIMWRYLGWVVERSQARVLLEAPGPLVRLALTIPGVVVVKSGEPMPAWHRQVSQMSLPALHRSTAKTVPAAWRMVA